MGGAAKADAAVTDSRRTQGEQCGQGLEARPKRTPGRHWQPHGGRKADKLWGHSQGVSRPTFV